MFCGAKKRGVRLAHDFGCDNAVAHVVTTAGYSAKSVHGACSAHVAEFTAHLAKLGVVHTVRAANGLA